MIEVAILGAGFSGICISIQLKKFGINSFEVFEKSPALGGTWHDNTYPGAACDVPSHLYSFSFEIKDDWTRKYSGSKEINDYLNFCADKYEIRQNITFNTEIVSANFDNDEGVWVLESSTKQKYKARFLVSGLGQLNSAHIPYIKGQSEFKGRSFHSSHWDHSLGLEDKRIAVIGNGGSAVQFIPHVGTKAKKLTVYQRSAHWAMSRNDFAYSSFQKNIFKYLPFVQRIYRFFIWLQLGSNFYAIVKQTWYTKVVKKKIREYLSSIIKDPILLKKLIPDYEIGCKRLLVVEDYYETLVKDNVHVIDVPIKEISENSVIDVNNNEEEVDVIIYGTGFQTSKFLTPLEVTNHKNISLNEYWKQGVKAHRGVMIAEFPNFFMLYGPNTNLGHNSIIFMIECQVNYTIKCIKKVVKLKKSIITPREQAMNSYNKGLQEGLLGTVFSSNCNSWYKNEDGKILNNYDKGHLEYFLENTYPKFSEYDLN